MYYYILYSKIIIIYEQNRLQESKPQMDLENSNFFFYEEDYFLQIISANIIMINEHSIPFLNYKEILSIKI